MVKQCVNATCHEEFKLLNGGDLYALERRSANTEFFWLCPTCAGEFELYLDPMGHVATQERSVIHRVPPPNPDANLRLISHLTRPRTDTRPSGERASTFTAIDERFSSDFRMRGGMER